VSYGEVLGDKSDMYIRVTLDWRYVIIVATSFGFILYCGCFS